MREMAVARSCVQCRSGDRLAEGGAVVGIRVSAASLREKIRIFHPVRAMGIGANPVAMESRFEPIRMFPPWLQFPGVMLRA